jgi:diguanylate cyclase (GGDEF)-like protein
MQVRSWFRYGATVAALATALTLVSLAAVMVQPEEAVSLIYPATGLGAAFLWGYGMRFWPAIAAAQFFLSYRASGDPWVAALVAAIELLIVSLFCLIVTRARVARGIERLRDLWIFVLTALAVTTIGGGMAAAGEWMLSSNPRLRGVLVNASSFALSDFISILVFVPLILSWQRWPFRRKEDFRQWIMLTLLLVTIGLALALAGPRGGNALFVLLPIVVFVALAAGVSGASASGAILLLILLGLHLGRHPSQFESMIRVIFVGTATATGYVVAVLWRERERGARRMFHLAHHDSLTGMANRNELERQLREAVTSSRPSSHALLYMDLDQFKLVNDTCGHMAGDRMLQELAAELQNATPPQSVLARLGGDEFACLILDATEEQVRAAARAIHEATDRYRFRFGAMSFSVGVSTGITFFPAEGGDTADAVLGRADVACYVAKENGRNRSHVYLPRDEAMLKWHSTIHEVAQLERAMEDGRLCLYTQRIVDISGPGEFELHEILLRYAEDETVRTSSEFLPVAQRFGLMDRIDRWVLEGTCRYLAERNDPRLRLSVNLSGSTLNEPAFYEFVIDLQKRYHIDPRQICLEVTEGVMIHRLRQAVESMKELRSRGFDIALDDFGAGVASFAYLQELPVTYVKLDGRITSGLTTDPASEVIVSSLVRLARLREIECIAEWVDSDATLERLRTLGVRYAQGYFIDLPVPLRPAA